MEIMEYSNTVEGFVEELRVKSGAWRSFPKVLLDCTLTKARCDRVPLADYGDMPHIFRMEEPMMHLDSLNMISYYICILVLT